MARRYLVVDDLDGETTGAETLTIAINGYEFEVDLAEANRIKFEEFMRPYVEAGRRVSNGKRGSAQPPSWVNVRKEDEPPTEKDTTSYTRTELQPDNSVVRAWWAKHWEMNNLPRPSKTGRIPHDVLNAYNASQRVLQGLMKVAAEAGTDEANGITRINPVFKPAE